MEDVVMRTFDFSPFARSAIGFETLFDRLNDWPRDTNEGGPLQKPIRSGGRARSRLPVNGQQHE
jgi:hypothetical protein